MSGRERISTTFNHDGIGGSCPCQLESHLFSPIIIIHSWMRPHNISLAYSQKMFPYAFGTLPSECGCGAPSPLLPAHLHTWDSSSSIDSAVYLPQLFPTLCTIVQFTIVVRPLQSINLHQPYATNNPPSSVLSQPASSTILTLWFQLITSTPCAH